MLRGSFVGALVSFIEAARFRRVGSCRASSRARRCSATSSSSADSAGIVFAASAASGSRFGERGHRRFAGRPSARGLRPALVRSVTALRVQFRGGLFSAVSSACGGRGSQFFLLAAVEVGAPRCGDTWRAIRREGRRNLLDDAAVPRPVLRAQRGSAAGRDASEARRTARRISIPGSRGRGCGGGGSGDDGRGRTPRRSAGPRSRRVRRSQGPARGSFGTTSAGTFCATGGRFHMDGSASAAAAVWTARFFRRELSGGVDRPPAAGVPHAGRLSTTALASGGIWSNSSFSSKKSET